MTKEKQDKPLATMTANTATAPTAGASVIQVKRNKNISSAGPIALPTRMVLSAFSGMGAAIFCHPLGKKEDRMRNFSFS